MRPDLSYICVTKTTWLIPPWSWSNPTNRVMMDCIICLSPPNIKQTLDLHHVVYLIHIYLNHIPNRWYTLTMNQWDQDQKRTKSTSSRKERSHTRSSDALPPNKESFLTINFLTPGYSCPNQPIFRPT